MMENAGRESGCVISITNWRVPAVQSVFLRSQSRDESLFPDVRQHKEWQHAQRFCLYLRGADRIRIHLVGRTGESPRPTPVDHLDDHKEETQAWSALCENHRSNFDQPTNACGCSHRGATVCSPKI